MDFASIWVILKAESCWAALILYRIGNTNTNTIQIKIQNGLYLMVRGDRRDDTSQPWEHPTQSQPNPGSRTDEMMNHPVSRQCNPHHEAAVVGRDGEVCQARDRLAALHQGSAPLRGELELGRVPRGVLHAGDLHARAVGHHLQDRHVCLSLDASRNTLMSK